MGETPFWGDCPVEFETGEETFFYCKRKVIKYRDSFSNIYHKVLGPDIDSVTFVCVRSKINSSDLFCALEANNVKSPLVEHFAAQERSSGHYTDPKTGCVLWRRRKFAKTVKGARHEDEFDGAPFINEENENDVSEGYAAESREAVYIWMNGGLNTFMRIRELDLEFINCLIRASELGLCEFTRLDLAVDFSQDLMRYVTSSIVKGYYESDSNPFGYGYLGGRALVRRAREGKKNLEGTKSLGAPVGKDSELASRFGEEQLTLETLYFGDLKTSSRVIIFYDKREESLKRWDGRWPMSTRIEVRLLARQKCKDKNSALIVQALQSYNDAENGWKIRMQLFVNELTDGVRFTTKKRLRGAEKTNNSVTAPWWYAFVGTLTQSFAKKEDIQMIESMGTEPELHLMLNTALKSRDASEQNKINKSKMMLEKAKLYCETMNFRDFCRKTTFHRVFKDGAERDEQKKILKPLFSAFEKKEKTRKKTERAKKV